MDYREKCIELLPYDLADETVWIYPASTTQNGVTTKRTEWQEGWNACSMRMSRSAENIATYLGSLPDAVVDLILKDKIAVHVSGPEVSMYVNCNDLFYWASADAEDFSVEDLDDYQQALTESAKHGDLLWVCRKRKMRPQKPYYKYFNEEEAILFDACGPDRGC